MIDVMVEEEVVEGIEDKAVEDAVVDEIDEVLVDLTEELVWVGIVVLDGLLFSWRQPHIRKKERIERIMAILMSGLILNRIFFNQKI